jgi:hypothetical protein
LIAGAGNKTVIENVMVSFLVVETLKYVVNKHEWTLTSNDDYRFNFGHNVELLILSCSSFFILSSKWVQDV